MSLIIPVLAADAIWTQGRRAFPYECCGFLLGRIEGDTRRVFRIAEGVNESSPSTRRNRFTLTAGQVLATDRAAARVGLDIIGIYHSHPEAPACPSDEDLALAGWPHFSHVIVAVGGRETPELTSWVLAEDRSGFVAEPVTLSRTAGQWSCPTRSFARP
jgi:proteasome lid subunit RPN8/RPN11